MGLRVEIKLDDTRMKPILDDFKGLRVNVGVKGFEKKKTQIWVQNFDIKVPVSGWEVIE